MIQLRWKVIPDTLESKGTWVGGDYCVLQYRLHFTPTVIWPEQADSFVGLKAGRECDTQWKDITVGGV